MKSLFISYTRTDENVIHRLCADFDRKGITYWLDAKEIMVGDAITAQVEAGISKVDLFCLCLSPSSVRSSWVQREYRTALSMQLSTQGARPRILPLLLRDCDIPRLLLDIKYADFSRSYFEGFHELCRCLDVQPDWEVPYKALVSHIESVEPLDSFLAAAQRGERHNLSDDWFHELCSLLRQGVCHAKAAVEELIQAKKRVVIVDHLPPPGNRGDVVYVILCDPISIRGDFDYHAYDDSVTPYTVAEEGLLEFLARLQQNRSELFGSCSYLLPRSFGWDISTFPDGSFEQGVDLRFIRTIEQEAGEEA